MDSGAEGGSQSAGFLGNLENFRTMLAPVSPNGELNRWSEEKGAEEGVGGFGGRKRGLLGISDGCSAELLSKIARVAAPRAVAVSVPERSIHSPLLVVL